MTKQELRQDSFVEWTGRATAFAQQNFLTLMVVVAAIAVAVVGTVYFQRSNQRSQQQASQLLYRASNYYASGAYSEGLLALDELTQRYGGSREGKEALYLAGACHLSLGETDRALERLRDYLDADPNGLYRESALLGLASAYETRGDLSEAAAAFRELRGELEESNALYSQASFGEARTLQSMGQLDEAIAILEMLSRSSDFTVKRQAESKLAALKALRTPAAS